MTGLSLGLGFLGLGLGLSARAGGQAKLDSVITGVEAQWDVTIPGGVNGDDLPAVVGGSQYDTVNQVGTPEIVGAGTKSGYIKVTGFNYWEGVNTTFMKGLHKSNADFTFIFAFKTAGTTTPDALFGTANNTPDVGLTVYSGSGLLKSAQWDGAAKNKEQLSNETLVAHTDYLCVLTVDEAANQGKWALNQGTFEETEGLSWGATAADPTFDFCLCSEGDGGNRLNVNCLFYGAAFIDHAVSDAELADIYAYYQTLHNRNYD